MDASTHFHDPVGGQITIAAPQASRGGSNNFHFYGPGAPAAAAGRNPSKPRKPFSTVPFPPDPDFVDRPDILKWMHEKCARPVARIALVGLGGIGKSQLAIQYAHQVRQRAPNTWVFWVHTSTRGRLEEAHRSIADRLELSQRNDPDVNVCRLSFEVLQPSSTFLVTAPNPLSQRGELQYFKASTSVKHTNSPHSIHYYLILGGESALPRSLLRLQARIAECSLLKCIILNYPQLVGATAVNCTEVVFNSLRPPRC